MFEDEKSQSGISDKQVAAKLEAIADEVEREPSRLARGYYAQNAYGKEVDARDSSAVCWCAYGFLYREFGMWEERASYALWLAAGRRLISSYNDNVCCGSYQFRAIGVRNAKPEHPEKFVKWFRDAAQRVRNGEYK